MKTLDLPLRAQQLRGCGDAGRLGGPQPPIPASGVIPQTSASAVHVERDGS